MRWFEKKKVSSSRRAGFQTWPVSDSVGREANLSSTLDPSLEWVKGARTDSDAETDRVHVESDPAALIGRRRGRVRVAFVSDKDDDGSSRAREKVSLERGREDRQEREREEKVPVDAILGHVFLRPSIRVPRRESELKSTHTRTCARALSCQHGLWVGFSARRTGYSTPLTMTTRTMPSAITGMDFLNEVKTVAAYERLGGSGLEVETDKVGEEVGEGRDRAWRSSGRAETRPRENTNDPTPRSIWMAGEPLCSAPRASSGFLSRARPGGHGRKRNETHERSAPGFRFRKLAREGGEVDGEDAEDRHDHHDGPIARDEWLHKQAAAAGARRGRGHGAPGERGRKRRRRRRRARTQRSGRGEQDCGEAEERVPQKGTVRERREREQEREDQDSRLDERNLERVRVEVAEVPLVDDDPDGIGGLSSDEDSAKRDRLGDSRAEREKDGRVRSRRPS